MTAITLRGRKVVILVILITAISFYLQHRGENRASDRQHKYSCFFGEHPPVAPHDSHTASDPVVCFRHCRSLMP